MTIGEFIMKYRTAKGLSRREMAFRLGVDQRRLEKWEMVNYQPKTDDAERIKDFFTLDGLVNISEDLLAQRIKNLRVDKEASLESRLRQKERLLVEKERRIMELSQMVNVLQESLALYKSKK